MQFSRGVICSAHRSGSKVFRKISTDKWLEKNALTTPSYYFCPMNDTVVNNDEILQIFVYFLTSAYRYRHSS